MEGRSVYDQRGSGVHHRLQSGCRRTRGSDMPSESSDLRRAELSHRVQLSGEARG